MLNDPTVSLRGAAFEPSADLPLPLLIKRINEQRGSFREVSEAQLQREIDDQADGAAGENDITGYDKEDEAQDRREHINASRQKIVQEIGQAQHQSAVALDFVSLLLSQRNPTSAATTVSPFIKQNIPLGSLGAESLQLPARSTTQQQRDAEVSLGWRLQSIGAAADALTQTSSRLRAEIDKESAYWDEIVAVKQRGWPVSRLLHDKHTLGIRYGFLEAQTQFKQRGFAPLQRGDDGRVRLGGARSVTKTLRLRLLGKAGVTAEYCSAESDGAEAGSLQQEILQARDGIYDEELVYELHREAQHLANQDVQIVDDAILLPFGDGQRLEIGLIDHVRNTAHKEGDSPILDAVACCLRLLLSEAHRQNLVRRSQPPNPVGSTPPARPVYPILKPLLDVLLHRRHLDAVETLVGDLKATLSSAGLALQVESSSTATSLAKAPGVQSMPLLEMFSALAESEQQLMLPGVQDRMKLVIKTSVASPTYGTLYRLEYIPQHGETRSLSTSSLAAIDQALCHWIKAPVETYVIDTVSSWGDAVVYPGAMIRYHGSYNQAQNAGQSRRMRDALRISIAPQTKTLTVVHEHGAQSTASGRPTWRKTDSVTAWHWPCPLRAFAAGEELVVSQREALVDLLAAQDADGDAGADAGAVGADADADAVDVAT